MNDLDRLSALLDLAEEVGIGIRRAPASSEGQHPGGAVVKLRGKEILFLDPSATTTDQVTATAAALRGHPELADRYLRPELRALLEADDE
jgi:hypothetical protein